MAVAIAHPKAGAKLHGQGTRMLVASGRADSSAVGVFGQCALTSDLTKLTDGTLLHFRRFRKRKADPPFYRWAIHFALPQDDTYRLSVVSFDNTGKPSAPKTVDFSIVATKGILIAWPGNGEDLTSYVDDFVPYGTLGANPFQNATMISGNGLNINLLSSFSDNVDLMCWSASFDTLVHDGSNYTLTASDTAANDSKNNLIV